ncbi:hypothetical protein SDC9_173175 [bioreactor metagenome]|uniref:Uncharacterized protein n=1 Tax=bioreactor metagenome TaxID=1076179 RepID=A0A645GHW7_9ZZZZ
MHLAGLAVEFEDQLFVAVHQGHRVRLQVLHFLRAQVEAVAQAVAGDHQRHHAFLVAGLVGFLDQLDAVLFVELAGLGIEDVAEVSQLVLRVGHRVGCRLGARRALVAGLTGGFELLGGLPA